MSLQTVGIAVGALALVGVGGYFGFRALERNAWELPTTGDERIQWKGANGATETARLGEQLIDTQFSTLRDAAAAAREVSATAPHVIVSRTNEVGDQTRYFVYDVQANLANALPGPGEGAGPELVTNDLLHLRGDRYDDTTYGVMAQQGDRIYRTDASWGSLQPFVPDGTI